MQNEIIVSVVIPMRNEEKYLHNCINSLLEQDYPKNSMEIIFVDGQSTDGSCNIIQDYIKKYGALFKLLENPNKTVPYAMNIGIKQSLGRYIIRMDAHSLYNKDYISKSVYYLENTDADNVGGIAITKNSGGYVGDAIAIMLSSIFGVGNSQFRIGDKDGYVDTVAFGAFHRNVFEKYGYYDERLDRGQDNELNYRIRKNGGKIYLCTDIKFTYFCRDNINDIANMAFKNGKWNVITQYLCPNTMSLRHFIPFFFAISIILMTLLTFTLNMPIIKYAFVLEIFLYLSLDFYFSLKNIKYLPILIILFPIFHLSYGIGSLIGLLSLHNYK